MQYSINEIFIRKFFKVLPKTSDEMMTWLFLSFLDFEHNPDSQVLLKDGIFVAKGELLRKVINDNEINPKSFYKVGILFDDDLVIKIKEVNVNGWSKER